MNTHQPFGKPASSFNFWICFWCRCICTLKKSNRCRASIGPEIGCGYTRDSRSNPSSSAAKSASIKPCPLSMANQKLSEPPHCGAAIGGTISLGCQVRAITSSADKPWCMGSPDQTGSLRRSASNALLESLSHSKIFSIYFFSNNLQQI